MTTIYFYHSRDRYRPPEKNDNWVFLDGEEHPVETGWYSYVRPTVNSGIDRSHLKAIEVRKKTIFDSDNDPFVIPRRIRNPRVPQPRFVQVDKFGSGYWRQPNQQEWADYQTLSNSMQIVPSAPIVALIDRARRLASEERRMSTQANSRESILEEFRESTKEIVACYQERLPEGYITDEELKLLIYSVLSEEYSFFASIKSRDPFLCGYRDLLDVFMRRFSGQYVDELRRRFPNPDIKEIFPPYIAAQEGYTAADLKRHDWQPTATSQERTREQVEQGRRLAQSEQANYKFFSKPKGEIADGPFLLGYCTQWRDFHELMCRNIARALLNKKHTQEVRTGLINIFSDQFSRWKKYDAIRALDFFDQLPPEVQFKPGLTVDYSDSRNVVSFLKTHVFYRQPSQQAANRNIATKPEPSAGNYPGGELGKNLNLFAQGNRGEVVYRPSAER